MRFLLFLILPALLTGCHKQPESPTVLRNFESPATAAEVVSFSRKVAKASSAMQYYSLGLSEGGSELASVRINTAGADMPLRILVFAQQHGNEQSGKEALLLLLRDVAEGKYSHWLPQLDIWVVPQLNPEGSDENQRRNAGGIDLNRDHIVQQAPETRALHQLFREFMPHVTIDIHEYMPFREPWQAFGAYKTFDVQVGTLTHINIDESLRDFGLNHALPHIENHLNKKGYSFHNYIVGPVPGSGRTRYSTVDFDDGRQSFGVLGTQAFIFEGINGRDGFIENLERRTYGQFVALTALLDFLHAHVGETRNRVETARANLENARPGEMVAIRLEHFPNGNALMLNLTSSKTGNDTLVIEKNYHPRVKATLEVTRPAGYLVPRNNNLLTGFLQLHNIQFSETFTVDGKRCIAYYISSIEPRVDEELTNQFPVVEIREIAPIAEDYLWVPITQLHSLFLVSLFEPQSMLGLAQRPGYEELLKTGEIFPILRVE